MIITMRVVHLERNLLVKLSDIVMLSHILLDGLLDAGRYKEVLLL